MFRGRTFRPALEALEPRQLMAADPLPQAFFAPYVPGSPILTRPPRLQGPIGPVPQLLLSPAVYVPAESPPTESNLQSAGEDTAITNVNSGGTVASDLYANYSYLDVAVVDGVLKIHGQWGNANIRILGGDGTYRIEPYYTRINGEVWLDQNQFVYTGITGGIDIDLGSGDDSVEIQASNAPRITIRTGIGNDKITLVGPENRQYRSPDYGPGPVVGMALIPVPAEAIPLVIAGDLLIDTGAGNDRIAGYANAAGNVTVWMGDGDDSFIEGPLSTEFWRPPTARTLSAGGTRTIDLGAGQDVENIPADVWQEPDINFKLSSLPYFFDAYRGIVARGESTPGVPQIVRPFSWETGRVDGEGRLEVEIQFTAGFRRVIDRLIARGVTIDAYNIITGAARAVIREEDLRLFGNLPELIRVQAVNYSLNPRIIGQRPEYAWDYIRPGSAVAEEKARWGPRPPVTVQPGPPTPAPRQPTTDPPIIGPIRIEEVQPFFNVSLLHSYYGSKFIGPQVLYLELPRYTEPDFVDTLGLE